MRRRDSQRIDYDPGNAARAALAIAAERWPELSRQALIDFLLINGLSALMHGPWEPPSLSGRNRARWRLPNPGTFSPIGEAVQRKVPAQDAASDAFLHIALQSVTRGHT